jgi:hypothetical protein
MNGTRDSPEAVMMDEQADDAQKLKRLLLFSLNGDGTK